jgi:membrane protein
MKRETSKAQTGSRPSKKPQSLWRFAKTVFTQWFEDQPFQLASSLSYYTLFSLAPLLIIAIAVRMQ